MYINPLHQQAYEAMKAENHAAALELFNKALDVHPNHPDILSDRGVNYLHMKNKEACLKDLELALKIQPGYGFRYASLGYAANFFGDLDRAISLYEKAVEVDPDDAVAHNNLGLLLEQKGFKSRAEEQFKRADQLAKMEDHLYEVMDELEKSDEQPQQASSAETQERALIPPDTIREENLNLSNEFKKIFTSKKQFQEFLRFVKNGFKIK